MCKIYITGGVFDLVAQEKEKKLAELNSDTSKEERAEEILNKAKNNPFHDFFQLSQYYSLYIRKI